MFHKKVLSYFFKKSVNQILMNVFFLTEETQRVLRLSLDEFSLPKFYLLFGISKVKSAAVTAFRSAYRHNNDRGLRYLDFLLFYCLLFFFIKNIGEIFTSEENKQ